MEADHSSGYAPNEFVIDYLTVGAYAHGFGSTDDGRPYAFRTVKATMTLEIYRRDLDTDVPAPEDVTARADAKVTDVDLDDERSVVAMVRDLVPTAVPVAPAATAEPTDPSAPRDRTTVRALLARISSVIDGM
ncbi:hypothetical protein [Nocardia callitridis]|uniref:Uncharacterized protein n=1 Tax=Nocardia callitridis TaxID=648753 RepID=A0ABP9K4D9_9NOCA